MHSRSRSVAGVASKGGMSNPPSTGADAALAGADASAAAVVAAVISRRCRTVVAPRRAGRKALLRRKREATVAAADRGRAGGWIGLNWMVPGVGELVLWWGHVWFVSARSTHLPASASSIVTRRRRAARLLLRVLVVLERRLRLVLRV